MSPPLSSFLRPLLPAVLLWLGWCQPLPGQHKFGQAVKFAREGGQPLREVRTVVAGADGFVWAGSTEGLFRFDGHQFRNWKHDPARANSLSDNTVTSILAEKDEVWVASNMGISVLDIRRDTFRHYQISANGKEKTRRQSFGYIVHVIFKDPRGNIWIGTRDHGVWRYRPESDDFYQYPYPESAYPDVKPLLGPDHWVLSLEAGGDSLIWAGTPGGLQQINVRTGAVRWFVFPQPDKDYQVNVNAFRRLCHHTDGKLYVGSWMAGMSVFDPSTGIFSPLPLKNDLGKEILASPIYKVISRDNEELWISALEGFVVYHTGRREVIFSKRNDLLKHQFYGVESIDRAGRYWQGTLDGIQCFDPQMQQFTPHSYEPLHNGRWGFSKHMIPETGGNAIMVCPIYTDGVYRFDLGKQSWTKYPFAGKNTSLTVRGFVRRRDGSYMISAEEGLFHWAPGKNNVLRPVNPVPGLRFQRWGHALTTRAGKVWVSAGSEGLVCFDPETHRPRIVGADRMGGAERINLISSSDLFEDNQGNIWFSRNDGLGAYSPRRDTVFSFIYPESENTFPIARSFMEDRRGRLWVVGNDSWIGWANPEQPEAGVLFKMNLAEKGISEHIHFITADAQGDIWGYTNRVLFKIDADNLELSTYNFKYGVEEADFFHFSVLPSGVLLFGGRNDIVLADPSELQRNRELPVPYITEVRVLNQPHPYKALFGGETLRLAPSQNFFSVGFSAQAFTLGNDTRFRYRLAGFDDWAETDNRRFANYTNVPGGKYLFQLQAANNEGHWNDAILEIPVFVATAWWASWCFRAIALVLVAGLVIGIFWYRIRQVRRKARIRAEYEKRLAQMEMSALLAQMNPHFLFNSLNSIDSYIVKNESKKASEYLNNFARLMRLMLQHSRSELVSLADELETLDLYLQMESLRLDHCFEYEIRVEESLRTSSIVIPPMLIQPFLENAIWHGVRHLRRDAGTGKILLRITRTDDCLRCVVEDNGIGREKSAELKAGKAGKNHKKSMGMSITRDRIELLNQARNVDARIEVFDLKDENGQARGTRVELTIPV